MSYRLGTSPRQAPQHEEHCAAINGVDTLPVGHQTRTLGEEQSHKALVEPRIRTLGEERSHNAPVEPRYRGVSYEKRKGVFRARLYCKRRRVTLGRYATSELAARAHDQAAVLVMGDQALTNFAIEYRRGELERTFASIKHRRPILKLFQLRSQNEQEGARLLSDELSRMRQAAATTAFFGPGATHQWCETLAPSGDGSAPGIAAVPAGLPRGAASGHAGGSVGCSSTAVGHMAPNSVNAWKALVLAAARCDQGLASERLVG